MKNKQNSFNYPQVGKRYRNFKGGEYLVRAIVLHSETLEEMVFYEALYDNPVGKWWVRPLKMWSEWVSRPDYNYEGPRFTEINAVE